jgi:hypothetical protein
MSAPIIEVADEVLGIVNDFFDDQIDPNNQTVATRPHNPTIDLKNLCELRCIVFPYRTLSEADFTRAVKFFDYEIQILVQEKLGDPTSDAWSERIDELTDLTDALADEFRWTKVLPTTDAYQIGCEVNPIVAPEHLDKNNVFTSVINLQFQQGRLE